ncbi:iron permease [Oxalobacteraceae bacterium OM1]|nr:iron permease [Oxalobacteraceae bacterium OM1]
MQKRRIVIKAITVAGIAGATGVPLTLWAAVKKIDPKDPQAVSLGYVDDTTKADEKKYPKHDKSQMCSNCQFYQTAQEENKVAPCQVLSNKGVSAQGWCSAWVKKAG